MDTREEADWILDKLSKKLRVELLAAVEEQEGDDGVANARVLEERHHERDGDRIEDVVQLT